ncbi:MAG: DNA-processing protein DprA [Methylacidiphilales bacterium]|nr:DNA-processing protein DprA [Candidatus Methylacidiphilales bacterium]
MTESEAYFVFNLLPGIGPVRAKRLRERFGSLDRALLARGADLRSVEGIGPELVQKITSWETETDAAKERAWAEKLGLNVVTPADAAYPPGLREIYDPPLVLYIKGRIPETWPRGVAVVGSRETTHYGLENAKKLGYQIAYAGVPVISGLARGIDTAAHLGALAAKGVTWAVLGCGFDKMYPPENDALAAKIVESGGCLISELPLGTSPDKSTFPMRNRLVSGLSFGVLVIEAGRQSGALITARQALDQGRQVFAVPGRIDNPQAQGCHQLIRDGAKLVESVEDILGELEFLIPRESVVTPRPPPSNLSGDEEKVYAAIELDETPIDAITRKTGLPSGMVSSALLRLEMRKLIRQLPGKVFVRIS